MARALAVIGMLLVHVGPTGYRGLAGQVYGMAHGRAAILFVLIAGVGTSLLAASRRLTPGDVRLRLGWSAGLLLLIGLWLQSLDHHVLVVLQTYAALFLVGMIAIALPAQWLLRGAAAFLALGPLVFLAGRVAAPGTFDRDAIELDDPAWEIVHGILLSGPYPVITWAAPFLFGMWLGRLDLGSPRVQSRLVIGGATVTALAYAMSSGLEATLGTAVTPVTWGHVIVDRPHSQMPLWLLGAMGSACLVLGFSLALAELAGRAAWPLAALGQMALTFYAAHLLAFHFAGGLLTSTDVAEATRIALIMTLAALAAAVVWRRLMPRGPLETLLHAPWAAARPR